MSESERLIERVADLERVLRQFELWEAQVILHGDWRDECVTLTPELHEQWIALAVARNAVLGKEHLNEQEPPSHD